MIITSWWVTDRDEATEEQAQITQVTKGIMDLIRISVQSRKDGRNLELVLPLEEARWLLNQLNQVTEQPEKEGGRPPRRQR